MVLVALRLLPVGYFFGRPRGFGGSSSTDLTFVGRPRGFGSSSIDLNASSFCFFSHVSSSFLVFYHQASPHVVIVIYRQAVAFPVLSYVF